ncbi:unnamed protein product [Durusdinium trenchii]|uniref:Uncharacterized protein n=1 Tax=Durusdinium trenchii TaxID=1381693 RepID=A0ABP0L387_9DINO
MALFPSPLPGWHPVSNTCVSPPSPSLRAVGSRRGGVAPAACGVAFGLALAAGPRCSGHLRGPAVRMWQVQAKAKKDDAYKASVQEQGDSGDSEQSLSAEYAQQVYDLLADRETYADDQTRNESMSKASVKSFVPRIYLSSHAS